MKDIILSKSITGAMWKSKTKYCKYKMFIEDRQVHELTIHLVVVGTVGGLLDRAPLLVVPHGDADHGVHVEAGQLPRLDDGDADLGQGRMTHQQRHYIPQQ